MGPLIPEILSPEFNFVVALIIGIAFGFVLEQAGFSSSKKLAGVFYGYDFTVLRVFFTAGVTAMLGIQILSYFNMIDISQIYVNPMYSKAAIIGGVVMGLGFILGGFCPGTSITAAAIGKIDAMIFIVGIFLGVFVYSEGYPMLKTIHKADYLGNVVIADSLGMSRGVFAFLLTFVALFAFVVTYVIQLKVNGKYDSNKLKQSAKRYVVPISSAFFVALLIAFLPSKVDSIKTAISKSQQNDFVNIKTISNDELAYNIINTKNIIQLVDVRTPNAYKIDCIPGAINIPIDSLYDQSWRDRLDKKRFIVYYGNSKAEGATASIIASEFSIEGKFLSNGFNSFKSNILQAPVVDNPTSTSKFRTRAKKLLQEMPKYPVKKIIVRKKRKISGGCE